VHINLLSSIQTMASMTVGSFGYHRVLGVTSTRLGDGTLLIAGEANIYNGPWDNPDDLRKFNGVVRYNPGYHGTVGGPPDRRRAVLNGARDRICAYGRSLIFRFRRGAAPGWKTGMVGRAAKLAKAVRPPSLKCCSSK